MQERLHCEVSKGDTKKIIIRFGLSNIKYTLLYVINQYQTMKKLDFMSFFSFLLVSFMYKSVPIMPI